MRKVLLAIPGDSTFLYPSLLTFHELGWQTKNINYRKVDLKVISKHYKKLPLSIVDDVLKFKMPRIKKFINNREIIKVAKHWHPDLFLTFKGELISSDTILELKNIGVKTVNWYPDPLSDTEENYKIIRSYDCFVFWDSWKTREYHKLGLDNVLYLPFCTIPENTFPPLKKRYSIDFVATWRAKREAIVSPVGDLGLFIWGNNAWQKSSLSKNYQWGPVRVPEMIKIMRSSKITLNVHSLEKTYSKGTNVRTFEATGAGGFLLVNKRKSLYNLFKVGKEIEVFDSAEELVAKTKFYLKNDSIRERIAKAGWKRASKDHTYANRFKTLLRYLKI